MRECTHEDETLALGERFQNWGWKGGRVEGRVLHRLNCDLCGSVMDRIGEQGVEGWKGGGQNCCLSDAAEMERAKQATQAREDMYMERAKQATQAREDSTRGGWQKRLTFQQRPSPPVS